ncbi:protein FAM133B-like [Acropora millepora]|uniref:protein FAM133B-like n=1 Tax=Acropora millepora TaxID=45264 RepID=UPI001CF29A48|nr:protein FAM133B-like [Acropora millepora]
MPLRDDDEETDDTFDKMEHLGMLLYVIGSHQKQLRSLVRNPVEYSGKCRELPATHEFKANPTSKTLKEWRKLLADLGSDTDSDKDTTERKKKKGESKPQKSPSSSSSSSSTSSDEEPSPAKKSGQKRKTPELEILDDDLGKKQEPSRGSVCLPQRQKAQEQTSTQTPAKKKNKKA